MNGIGKKVTLETIYNALFTIGILILFAGIGRSEVEGFEQGITTIVIGIVTIGVGGFIYWLKVQETPPANNPAPINDIITPEKAGLPEVKPSEKAKEVEDRYG